MASKLGCGVVNDHKHVGMFAECGAKTPIGVRLCGTCVAKLMRIVRAHEKIKKQLKGYNDEGPTT